MSMYRNVHAIFAVISWRRAFPATDYHPRPTNSWVCLLLAQWCWQCFAL